MRAKLTAIILTYNHAQWIARSIEGALMQKPDFPFRIIVLDDASTDGTSDIVRDYAARHPDRIEAVIREKNLGLVENFYRALCAIETEYFCVVEGDDWWTDGNKLQMQIDLLDAHPDIDLCGHNTTIHQIETGEDSLMIKRGFDQDVTILSGDDLIRPHPSARLYRHKYDFSKAPNKAGVVFDTCRYWYYMLQNPKMIYIDRTMSQYNVTRQGMYSGANRKRKKFMALNSILSLDAALNGRYPQSTYERFLKTLEGKYRFAFWIAHKFIGAKAYQKFLKLYEG